MEVDEYSMASQIWALREFGKVGPRTFKVLLAKFRSIPEIHRAQLNEITSINGLGEKRSKKISDASKYLDKADKYIKSLNEINVSYCTTFDNEYPRIFAELNDPPPIFFYRGELPQAGEKTAAIVGSHKATNEGIAFTVELAERLARKSVSIVSGLARGIDAAAHIGALNGGGMTYAILGSGLDNIYPEENRPLAIEIRKNGGLISEYSPDAKYSVGGLMARNRLIVGFSQAVIIGEVLPDSTGTLDTARFCYDLGKLMFVLIDGCEASNGDNSSLEKVLEWGAIPISHKNDIDMVANSLI